MSGNWRIPFFYGEPVPGFTCATPHNPNFFSGAWGGHYTVLSFLGDPNATPGRELMDFVLLNRVRFQSDHVQHFSVITAEPQRPQAVTQSAGVYFFLDYDRKVSALFKAAGDDPHYHPYTLVLDPLLRVLATIPADDAARHNQQLAALVSRLPRLSDNPPGESLHAPVLVLPRVFEPAFCRELIALYQAQGGTPTGYMRESEGKTFPVLNTGFKRRKDFNFDEGDTFEPLRRAVLQRISRRLVPQIQRAFQFEATRIERYTVACYSAEDSGFFRAHRDNTTLATAHRRFACTINLNAEEFEGGELRFPEFGMRSYRAPTGGAVIFSCSLLHEALPVTSGDRYAFLPFFYNEQAAAIREANRDSLVNEVTYEH